MIEPLDFRLVPEDDDARPTRLARGEAGEISPAMWEQLARDIAAEDTLMPAPAAALAARWREGYAATAVAGGRIISFIALVPIIRAAASAATSAPTWAMLASSLEPSHADLPSTGVFGFTNSWTAPAWRRRGISMSLRPPLVDRHLAAGNLGILDMDGLASPVPALLGWQIMAWDRVPFVSSLVSLPASEFPEQSGQTWTSPLGLRRYQGPHVPLDAAGHPWEKYFYFWTSDVALTVELDEQVRSLFCGDLHRWRAAIAGVYSAPEMLWKVPFD